MYIYIVTRCTSYAYVSHTDVKLDLLINIILPAFTTCYIPAVYIPVSLHTVERLRNNRIMATKGNDNYVIDESHVGIVILVLRYDSVNVCIHKQFYGKARYN